MSYFVTVCSTFSTIKVKKLKKKKNFLSFFKTFPAENKGKDFSPVSF